MTLPVPPLAAGTLVLVTRKDQTRLGCRLGALLGDAATGIFLFCLINRESTAILTDTGNRQY